MTKSKPTVTVVQLATPNIDSYAIYSILSINYYCKKHGYEHIVQRSKTVQDMHINWSKIDLLENAFDFHPSNDYILLVDADVIISDYHKDISYFTDRYCKEGDHIVMAQDTPLRLSNEPRPNAGFVLLKNTETSKQMVKDWIAASTGIGKHYNDTHPRNQLVYWNYVMPEYLKHQVVLPRQYFMKPLYVLGKNVMPSKFLYHVTQSSDSDRIGKMKAFLSKHIDNIDHRMIDIAKNLDKQELYIEVN